MALAWDLGDIAATIAGSLILLVAAFVLLLDFRAPVHRAFSLLLLLEGLKFILRPFLYVHNDLGFWLRGYIFIALPFAALHFALAYRRRHGRRRFAAHHRPWSPWVISAVALTLSLIYFLDHSTLLDLQAGKLGPLGVFPMLETTFLAGVALLFATEAKRARSASSESAFLAAALALSLQPLFYGSFRTIDLIVDARQGINVGDIYEALEMTAFLVSVALVGMVAILSIQVRKARQKHDWLSISLWAAALASGAFVAAMFNYGWIQPGRLLVVTNAAWALALPILVAYALIRYRLFDAEVRIRFAVKSTTLSAVFVGTFLVVGQLTENWAQGRFDQNWVVAGIAAGLLLFAISPLQALAERVAYRAVPRGRPMTHLPKADRLRIYEEQLEVAWQDGTLTATERLLFTNLQERLGIPVEEATLLESRVLARLRSDAPQPTTPATT